MSSNLSFKQRQPHWFIKFWKKHAFKVLVCVSVIAIIILWLCNDSKEGTYSSTYFYIPDTKKRSSYPKESKGEAECRRVVESIFRRPFPNQRPLFLLNAVTGKPLEIDCCNNDMKLGIEYNGRQHYMYTKGMHKNYEAFRIQQYRDEMKKRLCEDNGFTLIVVPYTVGFKDIESFIRTELIARKFIN